jgi:transcriptional regulator with PAS, ATPase and Fis domain
MHDRKFHEDLYYRLNVLRIVLTPLRERPGDLTLLADALPKKKAPKNLYAKPTFLFPGVTLPCLLFIKPTV